MNPVWRYRDGVDFAALFDGAAYPTITYTGFRPCHELLAPEDRRRLLPRFDRDFTAELRTWRPVSAIRKQVDDLTAHFDEDTIGVHIRRGDAVLNGRFASQYRRSSDSAFIERMDHILRARPSTTFFLATDCADTEQRFRQRYGELLFTNPDKRFVPSIPHANKENQYDAVVDLFALARTGTILGTYFSTYSKTAAILGDGRLMEVVEDGWWTRATRVAHYAQHELWRRATKRAPRLAR